MRMTSGIVATLLGMAAAARAQTFQESGGLVVVEIESAAPAGSWASETSIGGYTGTSYYRWAGGNQYGSGGSGILSYSINITTPGNYNLRIRNHHNHPDSTLENDCWTRMDGSKWIKTYSSKANEWTWHTRHEDGATHSDPVYNLSAGVHLLEISGRSENFRIDRFHLYLDTVANPTNESYPESSTTPGGGTPGPTPTPTPTPTPLDSVESFTLIDGDTDTPIPGFDPLLSGAVLNLGTLPTTNLNIAANTSLDTTGSVVFGYDGIGWVSVDNADPFLFSSAASWTPSTGSHTISATPYSGADGTGTLGNPRLIGFTVVDDGVTLSSNGTGAGTVAHFSRQSEGENGDGGINDKVCGLTGAELALVWGGLLWFRRRRGRAPVRS